MGYYTDFEFGANRQEIVDKIHEVSGYGEPGESGEYGGAKWYDWADHLKEVSLLFPDDLIEISGEGEESGDIWRAYFKNGKSVQIHAELTHPNFDESMLK